VKNLWTGGALADMKRSSKRDEKCAIKSFMLNPWSAGDVSERFLGLYEMAPSGLRCIFPTHFDLEYSISRYIFQPINDLRRISAARRNHKKTRELDRRGLLVGQGALLSGGSGCG
jgi:hypothetical protein